ncbi:NAD(P)H-dependent oxidoreductase [Alpinimonas psychrophila]|uniref:Putative NADPH-quinone reductase n=1 Tax=Alpinimonas psychrophila TaxID=748908 RepID=A0A7W3JTC1_9MICO|nr:NAD(P)H-dependent oxidoreductase [Alpinimonas psychrophila]MBA8828850.1 putative NADPH-quinone reductase [Alpinimonas psychrophila]
MISSQPMKRIAVIIGHPIPGSFSHAITDAYVASARAHGAEVRILDLAAIAFESVTHDRRDLKVAGLEDTVRLGPEIHDMAETIDWAEHFVFAYPVWWGTYPAVLKGFFDRVFLAGFVFANKKGTAWNKFLTGRTARVFITMDAPAFFDKIWYRGASAASLKFPILWFVGVKTKGITRFDRVRFSTLERRSAWLLKTAELARKDASAK